MIPENIQEACNLQNCVEPDKFVCVLMKGAPCGLKESGRVANEDTVDHPALHGHRESQITPGPFFHETHDVSFVLVVDDFGIKCTNEAHLDHLITCLEKKHGMKLDLDAKQHVGIDLQWDHEACTLICSTDECIDATPSELQHPRPKPHCDVLQSYFTVG